MSRTEPAAEGRAEAGSAVASEPGAGPEPGAAPELEPLAGLTEEQRRAATALRGPVRILAGAGAGKTRTITHRIACQVREGAARAEQVLAVTFTERAAAELADRLAQLGIPGRVRAATFHAAAWAQLRYFWPRASELPLPEVLASKAVVLGPLARDAGLETADLAAEIEWAKARQLGPERYVEGLAGRRPPLAPERIAALYRAYEQEKARRNLVDYEDMLGRMIELLDAHDDIAAAVRARYPFLTVDEFQDVNALQWALLLRWLGDGRELCVVGDPAQAIYGFTGASPRYLTELPQHFPETRSFRLTRNHRSSPQVLALANALGAGGMAQRLDSHLPPGPRPQVRSFADAEAEVAGVVAEIRRLLEAGVAPGEIAVCYRTNRQSEPFEQALRAARLPFQVRGGGGFYTRPEIGQALRVLRQAVDRDRDVTGPPPPGQAVRPAPPRADRLLARILQRQLGWHPRREPAGAAAQERWRNLCGLVEIAAAAEQSDPGLDLPALVAELERRAAAGRGRAGGAASAVSLLTLHRAKGLEFDAVLIVSLEEGLVPITHARSADELAEEHRLLHVGVTRARRNLWLSWARARPNAAGALVKRRRSRFLPRRAVDQR